jgi:hypothetical protein
VNDPFGRVIVIWLSSALSLAVGLASSRLKACYEQ